MNNIKAFPNNRSEGMDLRDWLAGMAMQGIMSKEYFDGSYDDVATYAYKCADAIMKVREKNGQGN